MLENLPPYTVCGIDLSNAHDFSISDELYELCIKHNTEKNISTESIMKILHSLNIHTADVLWHTDPNIFKRTKGIGNKRYIVVMNMWREGKEVLRKERQDKRKAGKQIVGPNDIDLTSSEGRLLMATLSMLSTIPIYTDKTPEQIIEQVNILSKEMFDK